MKTFYTSEGRCLPAPHSPSCVTFRKRMLRSMDLIDVDDGDNGNGDGDDNHEKKNSNF